MVTSYLREQEGNAPSQWTGDEKVSQPRPEHLPHPGCMVERMVLRDLRVSCQSGSAPGCCGVSGESPFGCRARSSLLIKGSLQFQGSWKPIIFFHSYFTHVMNLFLQIRTLSLRKVKRIILSHTASNWLEVAIRLSFSQSSVLSLIHTAPKLEQNSLLILRD